METMDYLLKCPRCSQTPKPDIGQYDNKDLMELACERRHYIAIGDTLDQARVNWNQLISFARKAA